MKTCTVCKETLDYSHYHNSSVTSDGYGYRCKKCDKLARHEYRLNNKERFAEVSRRKQLKFKYGITLEEYDKIYREQKGCCALCETPENNVTGARRYWNFSVDHCHGSGKIRGLLCNNCNRGLGLLGDTKESLKKVLDYLSNN